MIKTKEDGGMDQDNSEYGDEQGQICSQYKLNFVIEQMQGCEEERGREQFPSRNKQDIFPFGTLLQKVWPPFHYKFKSYSFFENKLTT